MAILTLPNLRTQINTLIQSNGNQDITGPIMNQQLIDIIDSLEFYHDSTSGGVITLGQSIFVSPAGKTVAGGAVRESLEDHFSSLNEAATAALPGDTVHVYGNHSVNQNLAKNDVKYIFYGKPTITLVAGGVNMWDDLGASINMIVEGDADFRAPVAGTSVFYVTNTGTYYNFECSSIEGAGSLVMYFAGGTDDSVCTVKQFINSTTVNWTIRFRDNPGGTLICPDINCNTVVGGLRSAIDWGGTIGNDFTIIGNIRGTETTGQNVIQINDSNKTHTLKIIGKVTANQTIVAPSFWTEAAIFIVNGRLEVIGEIEGFDKYIVKTTGANNYFKHVGKASKNGALAMTKITSTPTIILDGEYTSAGTNEAIWTEQTGGRFEINGQVTNNYSAGDPSSVDCVRFPSNAFPAIIHNLVALIPSAGLGTPRSINATGGGQNIKIFQFLGSNGTTNNVTNLIPGSLSVVDSDYI